MTTSRLVSGGTPVLRGRSTESALLEGIVAAVRRGESRVLLLLGEEGAGILHARMMRRAGYLANTGLPRQLAEVGPDPRGEI